MSKTMKKIIENTVVYSVVIVLVGLAASLFVDVDWGSTLSMIVAFFTGAVLFATRED